MLVLFDGENVLQPMVPTSALVDFSKTAHDILCKLKYDKIYTYAMTYPIGRFLYQGFVDPVLQKVA